MNVAQIWMVCARFELRARDINDGMLSNFNDVLTILMLSLSQIKVVCYIYLKFEWRAPDKIL